MFAGLVAFLLLSSTSFAIELNLTFPPCTNHNFDWAFNHEGKSPCQVAAASESVCNGGTWVIPPISGIDSYGIGADNKCQCSTVVFSLLAACGLCQGAQTKPWSQYQRNCSEANIVNGSFPLSIPSNYSIPAWAYLDVNEADGLDVTRASQVALQDLPDSTTPSLPTSISSSSSHHSSHAGAIAGGVVGGLVGLGVLVAATLFFYRRRGAHIGPKDEKLDLSEENKPSYLLPTPYYPPSVNKQMKLYDPSDPTTYPTTPTSYQRTLGSPAPTLPTYTVTSDHSGAHSRGPSNTSYKGIPEI